MSGVRRIPPREFARRERGRYWRKRGRGQQQQEGGDGALLAFEIRSAAMAGQAILEKFDEHRRNERFCDCAVVSSDGKTYKVHRVLLASMSDFFRAAFTSPLSLNEAAVIHLDFPSSIVDSLIGFCYTAKCDLTVDNVQQILEAADQVSIIGLVEQSSRFLAANMTSSNAYGIFRFASTFGCASLAEAAWKLIVSEFSRFLESSELIEMDIEDLERLLSSDVLNVTSETIVFKAIADWIGASPDEREPHGDRLWGCVRFGHLSPEFVRTQLLTAPFVSKVSSQNLWVALEAVKQSAPQCRTRVPHQVVFAIGGWSSGDPTNCMETYDVRANRWFKSTQCDAVPRAYHGLVAFDNDIYMIGGFDGTNHFLSVRCFSPATRKWAEKSCMHKQRCFVSCVVVGRDIYAIGGFNGNYRMNSVERYSVAENQWYAAPAMNRRRSDCGAVAVGSKIYVTGGFNGQDVLNETECYDADTQRWTYLPELNTRRSGVCLVYFRDQLYAIGGFDGSARLNTVERLNPGRPIAWSTDVPNMITQRSNFASVVLEDKIYVIGGFNGVSTVRCCECFDGEKWVPIGSMNQTRSALSACICNGLINVAEFTSSQLNSHNQQPQQQRVHQREQQREQQPQPLLIENSAPLINHP